MHKKAFKRNLLSGALAALLFSGAKPFVHFFVESIMRNKSMKLFLIWASGSDVV